MLAFEIRGLHGRYDEGLSIAVLYVVAKTLRGYSAANDGIEYLYLTVLPGLYTQLLDEGCVVLMDLSLDMNPVQRMQRLGLI